MKEYIIKKINYNCPFCDDNHIVEIKTKSAKARIKDTEIEYEQKIYYCSVEDDTFVPSKIMDENLLKARDAYRYKVGLLTSYEIKQIRDVYDLTQKEFSRILGWGDVTIQRYEKKLIQDETYDNAIRMTALNPYFALEMLEKHQASFAKERYEEIKFIIKKLIKQNGNVFLKLQEIKNSYVEYDIKSDFNGYKLLDIEKINALISYFAQYITPLNKIKLMELLWYVDALYFKKNGKSMTGLVYQHLPIGAVPIAYEELLNLPPTKVSEEYLDGNVLYTVRTDKEVQLSIFSLEELSIINEIALHFKNLDDKEIINYVHNEIAYLETDLDQIIPYSLTQKIREL